MVTYDVIMYQVMSFLKIFIFGIFILMIFLGFWFFLNYKYKVELHKKTGSGIVLRRFYARKISDRHGNFRLKTLFGKSFLYPTDDLFLYKDGLFYLIRFYEKADKDYHPISMLSRLVSKKKNEEYQQQLKEQGENIVPLKFEEQENELQLKVIPQNIKFLFKTDEAAINVKYEQQRRFIQEYGQIIGLGIIAVAFIIGIYFIMNHVDGAIQLGNQALQLAARLQPNTIQSATPPI